MSGVVGFYFEFCLGQWRQQGSMAEALFGLFSLFTDSTEESLILCIARSRRSMMIGYSVSCVWDQGGSW